MRATSAVMVTVVLLAPAGAWACGQGVIVSAYRNLQPATFTMVGLDVAFLFYDWVAAPASRGAATTQMAVAATGAASSLALAFTNDAGVDGGRPLYVGIGIFSALVAAHAAWVLARDGDRPTLELSAGSGLGHGTLGTRIAVRHDGFGAHLAAGMPLAYGYQGIGGGLSWVGDGMVAPLLAINAALQTLPDSSPPYYGDTRALLSFSVDAGVRLRLKRAFVDLAVGPVAQRISATPLKPWRGDLSSGWTAAAAKSDFRSAGAWPLPIDVTVAVGVSL